MPKPKPGITSRMRIKAAEFILGKGLRKSARLNIKASQETLRGVQRSKLYRSLAKQKRAGIRVRSIGPLRRAGMEIVEDAARQEARLDRQIGRRSRRAKRLHDKADKVKRRVVRILRRIIDPLDQVVE